MMQEVKIRVRGDLGGDALYFISEEEIERSEGVSPGVILDHSKDGSGHRKLREVSRRVD